MFDPTHLADEIASWTSLGVKLPKPLAQAVNTFEAVRWIEVGHGFDLDITTITADNAEATIESLAEHIVFSETKPGALSAKAEAKRRIARMAAVHVIKEGSAAVPDIIEQLTPEFEKHVDAYIEAVSKLPEDITDESLIAAGPDAVAAYVDAQREAEYLNRISWWVSTTRDLPGHGGEPDQALNILRPEPTQLYIIDQAAHEADICKTLRAIGPVFAAAAQHGIAFGINTSAEIAEIRGNTSPRFVFS